MIRSLKFSSLKYALCIFLCRRIWMDLMTRFTILLILLFHSAQTHSFILTSFILYIYILYKIIWYYTEGFPINMRIERRLEYRLWFSIIDKWHKVHEIKMKRLMSFPKWGLHSCISKIDGDIKNLNSVVDFYQTGIWTNFPISPSILMVKNGRPVEK